MCDKIWEEGEIPKTWKHATITPLLKEGKNHKDVRTYKPVALTNTLCKIIERMKNERLVRYLEKEKKIDDRQFGFRKQSSTIDATSNITTTILNGFRRNEKTAIIFFDIKKAYDKVNREKILEQLENMGIQERMMEFIRELISERLIKVRVGGSI